MKLSIVIPVYNEKAWIESTVRKAVAQDVPGIDKKEIILVDDGSTDGTEALLEGIAGQYPGGINVLRHPRNLGKGAALATGFDKMTGDICLIQDADAEYAPQDYPLLLEPILNGHADVVYGSRFSGQQPKRVLYFWHYAANKFFTLLCNVATNLNMTDIMTGSKVFRAGVLKGMTVQSKDFCVEPELTIKIARKKWRIYEVGIHYDGRTYAEGKKITWVDGFKTIFAIFRFSVFS